MRMVVQGQGGAVPAPPAPPSQGQLEAQIEQAVQDAIRASLQGRGGEEAARAAGERARAAAEQLRAQIEAARNQERTGIVVQPSPVDVVPPEAVDISIAFFVSIVLIIVGLPIARAFARRMDRKTQTSGTATELSPRLDRIEQAIEAVAIEVERISENQRYTTKLMSEMRALPAANPLENWPAAPKTVPEPAVRTAPDERRP